MNGTQGRRSVEVRLPANQIVAEAKRWGIADEVGLRISPDGVVTIDVYTPRGHQFAEHLVSARKSGARSKEGSSPVVDGQGDCPALHEIMSPEWLEAVRWAAQIEGDVASRGRVGGALALKLARAVTTLNRRVETTGIIVRPAAVTDRGEETT
jgi:hypothetical protein